MEIRDTMPWAGIMALKALIIGLLSATMVSCEKNNLREGNSVVVTGDYSDLYAYSVTLYGWCNQKDEEGLSVVYGMEYSSTDLTTAATTVNAESKGPDNKYSCRLTGLTANTKYYYRAFVLFNGIRAYGEVMTFTTPEAKVSVTGEYSDLAMNSVTLYGWCNQKGEEGNSAVFGMEYSSSDLSTAAKTVKAESKDPDNKYSCRLTGLTANTKYYYRAYVLFNGVRTYGEVKTFTTSNISYQIPEAVDLGLSVKWASFNLGASNPEETGGYYQWAGTEDVTSTSIRLDWDNCPYHTGSNNVLVWTKYVPSDESSYWSGSGSPDNKTVLDPEDDVAHVKLGSTWKMPTYADWRELEDNCTWTWTTQSGVKGYKVTSKKSGFTKKSIFLPAAGYRVYGRLYDVGSDGYYWSSSLDTNCPFNAISLYFYQGQVYVGNSSLNGRNNGYSVRPVLPPTVFLTAETSNIGCRTADISGTLTVEAEVTRTKSATLYYSNMASTLEALMSTGTKITLKLGTDGSYSTRLFPLVSDTQYNYVVISNVNDAEFNTEVKAFKTQVEVPQPELVDLGLSVKWRSWNLGATKPEEYGGYYQWAGLEDVTDKSIHLDYNNCPYHTGSDYNTGWAKYIPGGQSSYWSGTGSPDNKTVLDPEDDVAHVKLGGTWRMPSVEEWDELENTSNCSWTWTSINGINGYFVQSKKTGFTDKWIFLPAAGYRDGGYLVVVGSHGSYWSSSLPTYRPCYAYFLRFDSDGVYAYWYDRYCGRSVRPVSE